MACKSPSGFSLVEVALALAVVAIALISLLALLPLGMKSNQISAEETRAAGILTALEADLRNTRPDLNGGRSLIYGLPLPYANLGNKIVLNSGIQPQSATGYTALLDETEKAGASLAQARFQVTVVYANAPAPGSLGAVQARLIVNWPPIDFNKQGLGSEEEKIAALTNPARVNGYVEAPASFPHP